MNQVLGFVLFLPRKLYNLHYVSQYLLKRKPFFFEYEQTLTLLDVLSDYLLEDIDFDIGEFEYNESRRRERGVMMSLAHPEKLTLDDVKQLAYIQDRKNAVSDTYDVF